MWGGRDILKMDSGDSASYIFVGYVLSRPYNALTISAEELGAMAKNNLRGFLKNRAYMGYQVF